METEPPKPPMRRPFLAFSLLNLLLGSALLVAVISHVVASRELFGLKGEVKKLRAELGYIDIKDPKKCYAVSVPQIEQRSYLFRIYLPPGHNYSRRYLFETHSPHGEGSSGGSGSIGESGEMTLRVKIFRDEANQVQIAIHGMGSGSQIRVGAETALASPSHGSGASTAPSKEAEEFEPGQSIELLTLEIEKTDDKSTHEKLKVWLEDPAQPLKTQGQ